MSDGPVEELQEFRVRLANGELEIVRGTRIEQQTSFDGPSKVIVLAGRELVGEFFAPLAWFKAPRNKLLGFEDGLNDALSSSWLSQNGPHVLDAYKRGWDVGAELHIFRAEKDRLAEAVALTPAPEAEPADEGGRLPTMDDIIDPDFTGGLTTEEYLARLHSGTLEPSPEPAGYQHVVDAEPAGEAKGEGWRDMERAQQGEVKNVLLSDAQPYPEDSLTQTERDYLLSFCDLHPSKPWGAAKSAIMELLAGLKLIEGESDATPTERGREAAYRIVNGFSGRPLNPQPPTPEIMEWARGVAAQQPVNYEPAPLIIADPSSVEELGEQSEPYNAAHEAEEPRDPDLVLTEAVLEEITDLAEQKLEAVPVEHPDAPFWARVLTRQKEDA